MIFPGRSLELAQRLFAQLQWEHSSHRYRKVLDIAANLLDYYPNFAHNDEVLSYGRDRGTQTGRARSAPLPWWRNSGLDVRTIL